MNMAEYWYCLENRRYRQSISREGVNKQLGHKGRSYDLFKFKGGIYCRHKWKKVLYRLEGKHRASPDNLGRL